MKKLLPISKLTRPFLLKFFADPKKKLCQFTFRAGDRMCVRGHINKVFCGGAYTVSEAVNKRMARAFKVPEVTDVSTINDWITKQFPQRTPRARILAALRAAAHPTV